MDFLIEKRCINIKNNSNIISYNSDYIARFKFDDEWNNKIKTARFIQGNEYIDVLLDDDDSCKIPLLKKGEIKVGVFTDTMTSTYVFVYAKGSVKDFGGNPKNPEPDLYAQLTKKIEDGFELAIEDSLTQAKESGIFDGYTPVRGTDYWTEEDINEIKTYVDEAILGGKW